MKRFFIIHGWGGYPDEGWFPWLKKELEQKGFQTEVPSMPKPESPEIAMWVSHISKVVGEVDEQTFFIGHSIGCQAILRYLETLPVGKKVGGVVFVAGFFTLTNLETDEEKGIALPWLETVIDFESVKKHSEKFVAIFSDNDKFVPLDNKKLFEQRLGAKTIVEHNKGHFSGSDEITELPIVLRAILSL